MDFLNTLVDRVAAQIDFIMMLLVFCGGYFQKTWLAGLKANPAFKTFIMSTIFAGGYAFVIWLSGQFDKATMPAKWFVTYCVATSIYELGAKRLFDWLDKKLNSDKQESQKAA